LIRIYLHLFQITKNESYKRVAVETLDYARREMLDESGGFYSAQDADSEGEEGKFFVWTRSEIKEILGPDDAKLFNFFFDVSDAGNFEGKTILQRSYSTEVAARALKIEPGKLERVLLSGKAKLFEEREKRAKPFRDEKTLTAWNGLMLAAFAEAAAILDDKSYLDVAIRNAEFILENLWKDYRLLRTYKDGEAKLNAYIEDYANLADGLIALYQTTGELNYLERARHLADSMITEFWDEDSGGFFFTSTDHEELIVRNKDFYDNATPSGNSAAADVLLKLSKFYGEERYERFAVTALRVASSMIRRYPQGFGRALSAIEFQISSVKEIALIGERGSEIERAVFEFFLPNSVVAINSGESSDALPLLAGKTPVNGKPTVYVCENFACQKPVITADELIDQLATK
jgi:uncharacterized protein YyaL (SSP411 family)